MTLMSMYVITMYNYRNPHVSAQELEEHVGRFGDLLAARHTHTLEGHQGAVPGHSAKRDLVATAGFDGTCRVWRPEVRSRSSIRVWIWVRVRITVGMAPRAKGEHQQGVRVGQHVHC